jgi:hypothetical protein
LEESKRSVLNLLEYLLLIIGLTGLAILNLDELEKAIAQAREKIGEISELLKKKVN